MPKAISIVRICLLIVVIVGCTYLSALSAWYVYNSYVYNYHRETVPAPTSIDDIIRKNPPIETQPTIPEEPTLPSEEIPERKPIFPQELNLDAPFYSQAPHGDWSFPWQEACEEASILLAANVYWKHNWTRDEFNTEILNMVDWQEEKFGTYLDTTVAQTAQIVNEYLKLETITHEDPTYDDVVEILNKGHFIIMFFSGKELGNPNFTNGGPVYHVVLVKGYKNPDKIITHDVGTRNGASYIYSWDVLESAMHDFAIPIQSGEKRMLEILPPTR